MGAKIKAWWKKQKKIESEVTHAAAYASAFVIFIAGLIVGSCVF